MQPHGKFDTGVDAGRNHAALKIVEPARSRVRLLAARGLAAVLILALAALFALPLPAQAQSKILVSNVGQSTGGNGSLFDFDQAQAFTTGSNSAGYTLKSVEIDMGSDAEYATVFTVSVHSNSSGAPGASLGILSNPGSLSRDGVYAFTTRGIALAASTTYFVVIDRVGTVILENRLYINNTASDAQDPGRASGWSIGNGSLYRDWDSSGSWTSFVDSKKIRVKGYNPTVSNASISIADASAAENAGHLLFEVTLSRSFQKTVKVDFETISGGTATEGEDYHARRTYTHVILAGDRTAQMGFALIEDTVNDAGETVKVKLSNARVVDAYGNVVSFLDITTAEATGTITAPPASTNNVPGLTIGIQDATGDEDDGWLDFRVRLSRKYDKYVCYDFETISGGTATEGRDYSKRPKVGGWVQIGKRVDKPFVRIIDDSVNDNGETVKVKISNAHLCGDASKTVSITRAEATGTIYNSDHMPKAWLARFGRTVAEHSLEAIGERLRSAPGRRVTLGGQNLAFGEDSPLAGSLPGAEPASLLAGNGDLARTDALLRSFDDSRKNEGGENSPAAGHQTSTGALLLASSFHLASAENPGTRARWSFWGRGTRTGFEGARDALTLDGDVTTATLGFDLERERWLLGVALSRSKGEGSFRTGGTCQDVCAGEIESTLTGVYPYVRYRVSEALSLWGAFGHGRGGLTLTQDGGRPVEADMETSMAAGGVRGVLFPASRAGDFELAVRSDLLVVSTSSEAVVNLNGSEAETSRLRLLLEGSREFRFGAEGVLTPSLEIGLRHDGGDAETGSGLELGGGLRWAGLKGFTVEVRARGLLAHEERDYEEWGVSASLGLSPGEGDRGLSMRVGSAWGAASGGVERIWSQRALTGGSFDPDARLEAEVGYGLDAMRGLLTPYTGVALSESGETYRAGARFRLGPALELNLEASLTEPDGDGETGSGLVLRGTKRW